MSYTVILINIENIVTYNAKRNGLRALLLAKYILSHLIESFSFTNRIEIANFTFLCNSNVIVFYSLTTSISLNTFELLVFD